MMKYCRKHYVWFSTAYGCTQCNAKSQRAVLVRVSAYGNGASGENKNAEKDKAKEQEGQS